MKTIRSHSLATLLAAAAFMTTALAATPALPINGAVETVENHVVAFPTMTLNLEGVGHVSQLGRFRLTMQGTVNLLTRAGTGTAEFVAADGSRIIANVAGQATLTADPDLVQVVEVFTIVSGTGRFAGATGALVLERVQSVATGVSTGTLSGTISLAGGKSP